ncbi:DUF2507 domain-containing protein [Periweissella cryptocerci]|uniref:DUF2507 domain-containing protein n=1 Tax=Periweissella cryptocerci TaxID=2506420 RepID=A0A4P6YWR1_9LACO|nr:YslB family protein [Periweissella cryptocerci]QBO37217.1 DUF2507 domain-containing protein [Periweissella cryptocerci]
MIDATYEKLIAADGQPNAFAVNVLRDVLIPDVLQEDTASILYWAGKSLARKYPLASADEIVIFFLNAGFGELELIKDDTNQQYWRITGAFVDNRFTANENVPDFNLEAGFIAQQTEQQGDLAAEANFEVNAKKHEVKIHVQIDFTADVAL